jgi:hypothetical protein
LDNIILNIVNTTASEHEPIHAHTEMLTFSLEALPHKHTGPLNSGHLAWPGGDLVPTLFPYLAIVGIVALTLGFPGESPGRKHRFQQARDENENFHPSTPFSKSHTRASQSQVTDFNQSYGISSGQVTL